MDALFGFGSLDSLVDILSFSTSATPSAAMLAKLMPRYHRHAPFACDHAYFALVQPTRCTEAISSTMRQNPQTTGEGCTRSRNYRQNCMSVILTSSQWGYRAVRCVASGLAVVASTPESSRRFEPGRNRPKSHAVLPRNRKQEIPKVVAALEEAGLCGMLHI